LPRKETGNITKKKDKKWPTLNGMKSQTSQNLSHKSNWFGVIEAVWAVTACCQRRTAKKMATWSADKNDTDAYKVQRNTLKDKWNINDIYLKGQKYTYHVLS
jgi:hypothetical protein